MTTWKVRSLRVTVFLPAETASNAAGLTWEQLAGAKPENAANRAGRESEEGPFSPGRLLLQKQPGRVDVLYAGFPQGDSADDPVATLGSFETARKPLRAIAQKTFQSASPCVRVALGTELVQAVPDAPTAYKTLVEHMGSATFKLDGGQEFVYQINRPRLAMAVPNLVINRLTRWNASSWQPVTVELTGGAQVFKGEPKVGAVITTDVNTDGERADALPTEKLLSLFDEMCDLTIEIRDKGDVS